jgi:hypothetical protein
MHKRFKTIILIFIFLALNVFFFQPSFATNTESGRVAETTFFGNIEDDGSGCGVFTILNLIVDIFSIGIVILAVIGVTIVGIKYLTASSNEEQTRKAKTRMFQIVIGLVTYAVLYIGVQWLTPGGKLDYGHRCATISDEELAQAKEKENAEREARNQSNTQNSTSNHNNSHSSSDKNNNKKEPNELGKKLLKEMEKTANEFVRIGVTFDNNHGASSWPELYRTKKSHCSSYVFLTLKRMGLLSKSGDAYFYFGNYGKSLRTHGSAKKDLKKNFVVIKGNDTIKNLVKKGKLVPGDICGDGNYSAHTIMYAGKSGKKYLIHSFGSGKFSKKKHYNVKVSGSYKIGKILHPKD